MSHIKKNIEDTVALFAWAAVIALAALIAFELIDDRLSYMRGSDAANYLLLAKAIATGQGYSDINIPGSPPHTQYPPLFPLILSPVYYLLGFNIFWMKAIVSAFGVGAVFGARLLSAKKEDNFLWILVSLLTCTNYYILFFMREVLSEIPYMALSLFSIYFLQRYSEREARVFSIAVPLFLCAAYLTRMIGITLYAGALVFFLVKALLERDVRALNLKKFFFIGITGALPFVIWSVRGHIYSEGVSTYGSIFLQADYYSSESGAISAGPLFMRALKNSLYYLEAIPKTLITWAFVKDSLPSFVLKAIEAAILLITAAGFLQGLFYKRGIKDFYTLFYLSLLMVWPVYGTGDARRYIVPLIPFIYLYFLAGFSIILGKRKEAGPGLRPAVLIPLSLLLAMNIAEIKNMVLPSAAVKRLESVRSAFSENLTKRFDFLTPEMLATDYFAKKAPCYRQYMMTAYYLRAGMNSNDVIMTRKPEIISLITGGYAVKFPFTNNPDEMTGFIKDRKVDYILVDGCYPEAGLYVRPFIDSHPGLFNVMTEDTKGTLLVQYKKDKPFKPR